jgi:hypothetical protein
MKLQSASIDLTIYVTVLTEEGTKEFMRTAFGEWCEPISELCPNKFQDSNVRLVSKDLSAQLESLISARFRNVPLLTEK